MTTTMIKKNLKDPMSISKLPSECFDEIFKNLKFDRSSLFSCLFVNRFWCRKIIPIIWRRPMPYNPRMNIINIEVFIPFFNEEEKSYLIYEGIDISKISKSSSPLPLFNYAQHIHILDVGAIEIATEAWFNKISCELSNPLITNELKRRKEIHKHRCSKCNNNNNNNSNDDVNDNERQHTITTIGTSLSRATNSMVDSLCKMFMRSAFNLKYLILSPLNIDKDIPKSNIFINNKPGLINLRKLKLRFYTNTLCQHEQRGNLYKLLKSLPNICNGLVHLDINRIKVLNSSIKEILAKLILSQTELTYCRFYKVFGDIYSLIGVLPVNKLTHLVLDDMILTGISLESLSQCTKLESLVLRKCRSITIETIQPILKSCIKLKFLHLSELPKDVINSIVIKASDSLEQVSIKFLSDDTCEGLENLVKNCQNITHLSLNIEYGRINIKNLIYFINNLKNLSHLKLIFGILLIIDEKIKLDEEFSKFDLKKLKYLELINIGIKGLKGYLSKCYSPLTTIIMDSFEENHIKIFLDFSKKNKSLKWVGIFGNYSSSDSNDGGSSMYNARDMSNRGSNSSSISSSSSSNSFNNIFDNYLDVIDLDTCKKMNEIAQGNFKVFPAKQIRIREKYF